MNKHQYSFTHFCFKTTGIVSLSIAIDIAIDGKADLFYLLLYLLHFIFCHSDLLLNFALDYFFILSNGVSLKLLFFDLLIFAEYFTVLIIITQYLSYSRVKAYIANISFLFSHSDVIKAFENIP